MKQNDIIAEHLSKGYNKLSYAQFDNFKLNIYYLMSEIIRKSGSELTVLSKQIIKSHIAEWFVKNIPMSHEDVACAVNHCREIFKEELGNEPAKYILRAGYAKYMVKQSNDKLDYLFLEAAGACCLKVFKEKFDPHEPAKKILMESFVKWMAMAYPMSEVAVDTVQWRCQQVSGETLTKEPAKLLLEAHYADFARKRGDSVEIVKANYSKLFNETFIGFFADSYSHTKHANSGEFSSSKSDIEGYTKESTTLPTLGVSSGDQLDHWVAANQVEGSGAYTQEMVKGCISAFTHPSGLYAISEAALAGRVIGGARGAAIGAVLMSGKVCRDGMLDTAYDNYTNSTRDCDRDYACNSSTGHCFDAQGICKADSSFVDSLGKESGSSSSSSSSGRDCVIC